MIKLDNIEEEIDVERLEIIDKIIEKIEKSIYTSEAEKKNYGEVFTAFVLINMMLDTLPAEVWINPYLKWLDPANGYGNFPAIIVQRLMRGLANVKIPETNLQDTESRLRWIMKKMIYVCDISIKNMKIYLEIFDREHKLNLEMNYFRGSFLNTKAFSAKMRQWGIKDFDIIVGNPPYNYISKSELKGSNQTSKKIWMKFIDKSMLISKYTLFVSPNNWLKDSCYLNDTFKKHLISAEVNSAYLKKEFFPEIGSTFSYYLLDSSNITIKPKIFSASIYIDIDFPKMKIFPTLDISNESLSIFNKVLNNFDSTLIFTRAKYNMIKNINNVIYIDRAKNNGFIKPSNIDELINIPGECYWYESNDLNHLNIILNNLNSKVYKFLIRNIKSGMATVSTINLLPIFDKYQMTDNDFYQYFNLTEKEINLINNSITEQEKIINIEDLNFKIGNFYEYTGRSKKITEGDVQLVKILKTSFQIKDILGNVSNVKKDTLKIKNE
jgi:hypothetical protein